ncbi:MAG TPA: hypothetical protein VH764_18040 [Gemmatimonadales bacterium]
MAPLAVPATASAQLPPVGVPPGVLRFELDGNFDSWDKRWREGTREPLGAAFSSSALGSDLFPVLAPSDTLIRRITGLGDYRLNLGSLTGDANADVSNATVGLALGVTRAVTVFGRLPLTRARMQTTLAVGAGGNAGLNPGTAAQEPFFDEFAGALTTLQSQIQSGAYDGDPAQRALAETTLAQGAQLFADLFTLLGDPEAASPFVPTGASDAGTAIDGQLTQLQTTLQTDLGVAGFAARPALPGTPATAEDVSGFIADPLGPIGVQPGDAEVTYRGDAEAGLAITLADRWDRDDKQGGFRAAAEGLVRFPTGRRARTDRLLAVGTGDGQTDVEIRGVVDLGSGTFGARLEGGYNRQLAADVVERVAPPTQPFPASDLLTFVRLDPGDVTTLAVRPFWRVARTFALIGGLERWSRGEDKAEYASPADAIPGVDPSVLSQETDASATVLSIGVTYSNPGGLRPGGTGLPVDAGWTYERVIAASGGIVPDVHRIRGRFRLYFGIW